MSKHTQLALIGNHTTVVDPHPESTAYSHIKFYNHLLEHLRTPKRRWCGIDCATKRFDGRVSEPGKQKMRGRLTRLRRWARETINEFIATEKAKQGKVKRETEAQTADGQPIKIVTYRLHHGEITAATIWDRATATERETDAVVSGLNDQLHRKQISQETYDHSMKIVHPELQDQKQLGNGKTT